MLHIVEQYYAQANNMGYTVVRDTGNKNKNGQEVYTTLGYVGNIKEVLDLVLKDSVQRKISAGNIELHECMKFIKVQNDKIVDALKGVIGSNEGECV